MMGPRPPDRRISALVSAVRPQNTTTFTKYNKNDIIDLIFHEGERTGERDHHEELEAEHFQHLGSGRLPDRVHEKRYAAAPAEDRLVQVYSGTPQ
jgi:hypothetical protein